MLRVTQVPTRFNNCIFVYGTITLCGYPFQNIPLINYYRSALVLQPRAMRCHIHGLGSSAFARHYLRNHCYFLFLWVLRCFSSPRSLTVCSVSRSNLDGLPHSDISGSMCICHSPKLFAAYHVLLRLREPRHPPYALLCFLLSFRSSSFHSHELFARSVSFASNTSMIFVS